MDDCKSYTKETKNKKKKIIKKQNEALQKEVWVTCDEATLEVINECEYIDLNRFIPYTQLCLVRPQDS